MAGLGLLHSILRSTIGTMVVQPWAMAPDVRTVAGRLLGRAAFPAPDWTDPDPSSRFLITKKAV
jgi:hypothetical protein